MRRAAAEIDGAEAGGPGKGGYEEESGPVRRCIVTGRLLPQSQMLRFVVGPDGSVVPDVARKLGGRGIWLSADRDSIITATVRNLFQRAARQPVRADAALVERVEAVLARRCVDLLALARRAGQAVAGFEKVQGWLRGGRAVLLVVASDGAAGGREKLGRQASGCRVMTVLRSDELAGAFGRDHAVFAAVAAGGLAERLAEALALLSGVRRAVE